jgi:hypothetical protein
MAARNVIKGKQLYRILFFGVIFTVLAVGTLALWGVREIRQDAAMVAVESSARGLSGAVSVLMDAVASANGEIGSQAFASLDPKALHRQAMSILRKHSVLTGVMISDGSGLRYMLARSPEGFLESVPGRDKPAWVLLKSDGTTVPAKAVESFRRQVLDSALSEEFTHLKPGQVNWRSSSGVRSSGESWLAASTLVQGGDQRCMASYIFPVDAIVNRLGSAEKGSAEKVFLYWDSGKVLPVPAAAGGEIHGDMASTALRAEDLDDPVIATAAKVLHSARGASGKPFSYRVDGEVWWGYVLPLSVFGDTMSLGVAVPRRNVVSTLTGDNFILAFGGILVLMAAGALVVLHRNRERIEAIGVRHKTPRTDRDVLRLIAEGESGVLEFKQTLRFNLKSGKNGKEIEHASLKSVAGFLNSEGGILLIGVADDGAVTGFAEDRFENADKALLHFNNLVNQQIGTEFSRYLESRVIEVQGKNVLAVHCLPAAAPAILDTGKAEEFYVRSGPASRQLTLSQFYDWLQKH